MLSVTSTDVLNTHMLCFNSELHCEHFWAGVALLPILCLSTFFDVVSSLCLIDYSKLAFWLISAVWAFKLHFLLLMVALNILTYIFNNIPFLTLLQVCHASISCQGSQNLHILGQLSDCWPISSLSQGFWFYLSYHLLPTSFWMSDPWFISPLIFPFSLPALPTALPQL